MTTALDPRPRWVCVGEDGNRYPRVAKDASGKETSEICEPFHAARPDPKDTETVIGHDGKQEQKPIQLACPRCGNKTLRPAFKSHPWLPSEYPEEEPVPAQA